MKCEKQRIIVAVIRVFSCCDDLKMLWWDDDVKKNQVKPPDIDSKKLNSSLFYPTWSSFPPFFFVQCSLLLSRWNNSERKLGWINFCWIKVQSNHFTHCTDSVKKIWDLIDVTLSDRNAFSKVGANKTNYSSFLVICQADSDGDGLICSGKEFLLWMTRAQSTVTFLHMYWAIFSWWQKNKQKINQLNLKQACSWPIRRHTAVKPGSYGLAFTLWKWFLTDNWATVGRILKFWFW